jgi:hypothetical protein
MASPTRKKKDHPLSMRLPEADVSLIDRAAAIRGRSRFVAIQHRWRRVVAVGACQPSTGGGNLSSTTPIIRWMSVELLRTIWESSE